MLNSMKTPIFTSLLVVYFASMNILQFFGYRPDEALHVFAVWNTASLAVLIIFFLLRYRFTNFSGNYIWLASLSVTSVLLTALTAIAYNNISIYSFSTALILPPVLLCFFLVVSGRYQLTVSELRIFNKSYILFALAILVYNLTVNFSSVALLVSGVYNLETLNTSSIFTNRNTYGLMLAIGVVVAFFQIQLTRGVAKRTYVAVATILVVATLSTMSRGAIFFCIVFFVTYSLLRGGLRGLAAFACVLIVVSAFGVFILGSDTVSQLVVRGADGSSGRDSIIVFGFSQINSDNVLFGVGPDRGEAMIADKMGVVSYHNTYISLLINGGVAALAVFALIIGQSFSKAKKIHKSNPTISAVFTSIIIAYLFYGMIESNLLFLLSPASIIVSLYAVVFPLYMYNHYKKIEGLGKA